jgi:hypothetical protein
MQKSNLIETRKDLWRFRHAQYCFDYVCETCSYVRKNNWENDHPLVYQVGLAVIVLYARPFTKCYGVGQLSDEIVPKKLEERHRTAMQMRDKVFAHMDATDFASSLIFDRRPEVLLHIEKVGEAGLLMSESPLLMEAFDQMHELAAALRGKCEYHIRRICTKNSRSFPKEPGIYKLDINSLSKDIFSERR